MRVSAVLGFFVPLAGVLACAPQQGPTSPSPPSTEGAPPPQDVAPAPDGQERALGLSADHDREDLDPSAVLARIHGTLAHCSTPVIAELETWLEVVERSEFVETFDEATVAGTPRISLSTWTAGNGIGAVTEAVHINLSPRACKGTAVLLENSNDTPYLAWFTTRHLSGPAPNEARVFEETLGLSVVQYSPRTEQAHHFHTARGLPKRDASLGSDEATEPLRRPNPDFGGLHVKRAVGQTPWLEGAPPKTIPPVIRVVAPGKGWLSYGMTEPLAAPFIAGDFEVFTLESHSRWGTATLLVHDTKGHRFRYVGTRGGLFGRPRWETVHGTFVIGVLHTTGHPRVPNLVLVVLDLVRGKLFAVSGDPGEFMIDGTSDRMQCPENPSVNAGQWTIEPDEDDAMPCRDHVFSGDSVTQLDCRQPDGVEGRVPCEPRTISLTRLFRWIKRR